MGHRKSVAASGTPTSTVAVGTLVHVETSSGRRGGSVVRVDTTGDSKVTIQVFTGGTPTEVTVPHDQVAVVPGHVLAAVNKASEAVRAGRPLQAVVASALARSKLP